MAILFGLSARAHGPLPDREDEALHSACALGSRWPIVRALPLGVEVPSSRRLLSPPAEGLGTACRRNYRFAISKKTMEAAVASDFGRLSAHRSVDPLL